MLTVLITACTYSAALHILKRIRARVPPGRVSAAIDVTLRVAGGGGGPKEPY
jgi:hypothetical protein